MFKIFVLLIGIMVSFSTFATEREYVFQLSKNGFCKNLLEDKKELDVSSRELVLSCVYMKTMLDIGCVQNKSCEPFKKWSDKKNKLNKYDLVSEYFSFQEKRFLAIEEGRKLMKEKIKESVKVEGDLK